MINKDRIEANYFYELRKPQETPYGKADYIFVDQDKNQWLASRRLMERSLVSVNPTQVHSAYECYPIKDKDGNLIQAPENWDEGKPLLLVGSRIL